ncbi:hypothetical protein [Litoreibacter roseus]|uniref:Response regulator n=1 Tax=Litoreibacter roseus TaxID=2601869 RepID=A0A6N6JH24_9RHOB|nr:hypothetical protein [Litoreibacter roseus]GFE65653.1 response regulator [Litoreibacter roseus]
MTDSSTSLKTKLLYLEDEVFVCLEMADSIRLTFDVEVFSTHTLQGARDLIARNAFDYALLDVNLGRNEKSIGLGKELQEKGTKVLFCSGYESADLNAVAVHDVIEKPFRVTALTRFFGEELLISS